MTKPLRRPDVEIVWRPQAGPQHSLVTCPVSEIFFGGARGGGKTDGVLGKWAVKAQKYGRGFNARMFRKTQVSSEDAIERSKQIYGPLGGKFNETTKIWRMPHGGRVGFAYLESVDDAQAQQGKNLSDAWVEEAGQYLSPDPIDRLFGALRSAENVPVQLILTANPGGAGQHWLAKRYGLVPFPRLPRLMTRILPNGALHEYAVIPSRLTDNKIMIESDPQYINRLQLVGSEQLVRAWLDGDWSAVEGAFFPEWNPNLHVIPPFAIPDDWTRFRSADWGSAHPFSIGWWAIAGDDAKFDALGNLIDDTEKSFAGFGEKSEQAQRATATAVRTIPRGAIIRYREWYGALKPNVGLKLPAEDVGAGIVERERGDPSMAYSVLDPAAFSSDGGPSIAERLARHGAIFRPADNARVARRGAMGGWDQLRGRLIGENGLPMFYVFSTCVDLIRTLPALQHDKAKAEDVDCWVAGTMISTPNGDVPIESVRAGDLVDTPVGARRVLKSYVSGPSETSIVKLSNGAVLEGTPHHKIMVKEQGLIQLAKVTHDVTLECKGASWKRSLLNTAVSFTQGIRGDFITTPTGQSFKTAAQACIAKFGWMLGATYRQTTTFITAMKTSIITSFPTTNACRPATICGFITPNARQKSHSLPQNGAQALLGGRLLGRTPPNAAPILRPGGSRALIVELLLRQSTLQRKIARMNALRPLAPSNWTKFAKFAALGFGPRPTKQKKCEPVRIVAVGSSADRKPVYNLTVDDAHMFYANGILSSNTNLEDHAPDDARYGCLSRPWVRTIEVEEPRKLLAVGEGNQVTLEDIWPKPERRREF